MILNTTNDFHNIVINNIPLIDVRAPIEFEKGAFPNSVNLPIMDDLERHQIGLKYKESGNEKATELGYKLVSGQNKEDKITKWLEFIKLHPNAIIYCFRGGQRSGITQEWIIQGLKRDILRIEGGYKAFRHYLMDSYEPANQSFTPIRLGGHTGSGKTPLLNSLPYSIDLEGIANHRGSSFGGYITPQPSQIDFENRLAYQLISKQAKHYSHLVFEDEGRHIGRCFIPENFSTHYMNSDLVVVNVPFYERAQNILEEYVNSSQASYIKALGQDLGLAQWLSYIITSIDKAKKRLGGVRHKDLTENVQAAFDYQMLTGSVDKHLYWIESFLKDYYDPMYEYQLEKGQKNIIFRGDSQEVKDYLNQLIKIN
jgi:tRNA 2-selenouridine synthase